MKRISAYINSHFFSSMLAFFIPLFGIASLIFFVKLVSITSVIHISLGELIKLYLFILPQILFYTLSITFFIAAVSSIYQLSFEFELIALFALGVSPNTIIKIFRKNALFLSIILLLFGLILIPQAKQLYKGFIAYKRTQIQLTIKPNEFGHRFGDWYLFIGSKRGNTFEQIALYNNKLQNRENFIVARRARLSSDERGLRLTLFDGKTYSYNDHKLQEMEFEKMEISNSAGSRIFHYEDVISYWFKAFTDRKRAFDLTFFIFLALFPLASLYYIAYLGITNSRYERRNVFLTALGVTALYFAISFGLARPLGLKALLILPLWVAAGYWLYRKKILKRY
ncbi:MAG: LptF/LptG family permease [Epsilonproteobacteria bacterium]|nr:hypothetical protein [Campylobacterota bacterium]NPA57299.1 LptF/LptG family permease [Campylobacterota bacterium]